VCWYTLMISIHIPSSGTGHCIDVLEFAMGLVALAILGATENGEVEM
jgi:hypothetical protein